MKRSSSSHFKPHSPTPDVERVLFIGDKKAIARRYWEDKENEYFFEKRQKPGGHMKLPLSPVEHKEHSQGFAHQQWIIKDREGEICGWFEVQIKLATFSYGNLLFEMNSPEKAVLLAMIGHCFQHYPFDYVSLFHEDTVAACALFAGRVEVTTHQGWAPTTNAAGLEAGGMFTFLRISRHDWEEQEAPPEKD